MSESLSLEQRIHRLESVEEIKALKYRYWRACDMKNPEGFRASFTQTDSVVDFGPLGSVTDADGMTEVYKKMALERDGNRYVVLDMHHGMQPDIQMTSDTTAEGKWTLRFRQVNRVEATETVSAMEYEDSYVIENGAWKKSHCKASLLWSSTRPLGDDVNVVDSLPVEHAG